MPEDTGTYEEGYADACDDFRAVLEQMGAQVHITSDEITICFAVIEGFTPETVH